MEASLIRCGTSSVSLAALNSSYATFQIRCQNPLCFAEGEGKGSTAVRAESRLVTCAAGGELVAPPAVLTIDQTHEFRRGVPMVVLAEVSFVRRGEELMGKKLTGGRYVSDATSQRGLKIKKSVRGVPGVFDLTVRTQNIEGSMWSCRGKTVDCCSTDCELLPMWTAHLGDGANVNEFLEGVFVGNIAELRINYRACIYSCYLLSVPSYHIKRGMLLLAQVERSRNPE